MKNNIKAIIDKLAQEHSLSVPEYIRLLTDISKDDMEYLAMRAQEVRKRHYGNDVYIRGLIEISNICKNNCYYCGIRASNSECERYHLSDCEILECCDEGYRLGFRTFVLQGGEDPAFTDDRLCTLKIGRAHV